MSLSQRMTHVEDAKAIGSGQLSSLLLIDDPCMVSRNLYDEQIDMTNHFPSSTIPLVEFSRNIVKSNPFAVWQTLYAILTPYMNLIKDHD